MTVPGWVRNPTQTMRTVVWLLLSMVVAGLITLAFIAVLSGLAALHTRDDTAARAAARITAMTKDRDQLAGQVADNAQRIGELETGVAALTEQVHQAHLTPVVTFPPRTTTTRPPTATTRPSRPPATSTTTTGLKPPTTITTTTAPPTTVPPRTTPTSCVTLAGLGVCR